MVTAERTEAGMRADGMRGWITIHELARNVVRFVRLGGNGPEALYDVVFMEGAQPQLYSPQTPILTADELAQYRARELALENMEDTCSDRYNTIALRDPESDGWLVWALAATTDPDAVIVGGHYRFTISPDGELIEQADRLFRGCVTIGLTEVPDGAELASSIVTHIVSPTPVETHVFASLNYQVKLYVGTKDGLTWKADQGALSTVDQDAPGLDGVSARHIAGVTEFCIYIVTDPPEEPPAYYLAGEGQGKIIQSTEDAQEYAAPEFRGMNLVSIACARNDIVPSPNDYKVALAGYELYISDAGEGHPERGATLSSTGDDFLFELEDGAPFGPDLQSRIDARLEHFREAAGYPP